MDKKYLMIGGGVLAVAAIGFIAVKRSQANAQDTAEQSTPIMADTGYFSSLAPMSGGVSGAVGGGSTDSPTVDGNSGTTPTGGGFDIGSLLGGLITSQSQSNQAAITANAHNTDAAILASVVGGNGTATVSHSTSGTTVSSTPSGDMYDQTLAQIYKEQLGREPDAAGMAFFKNAMMNSGASVSSVTQAIQKSDEYHDKHPAG